MSGQAFARTARLPFQEAVGAGARSNGEGNGADSSGDHDDGSEDHSYCLHGAGPRMS